MLKLFSHRYTRKFRTNYISRNHVFSTYALPKTITFHHKLASSIRQPSPIQCPFVRHKKITGLSVSLHRCFSTIDSKNKSKDLQDNNDHPPISFKRRILSALPPKLRDAWEIYGTIFLVNYFTIYFGSIGVFFVLYDTGVVLPSDIPTDFILLDNVPIDSAEAASVSTTEQDRQQSAFTFMINKFGLDAPEEIKPWMGNFAMAWMTSKMIEPLRAILAISTTPFISRLMRKKY